MAGNNCASRWFVYVGTEPHPFNMAIEAPHISHSRDVQQFSSIFISQMLHWFYTLHTIIFVNFILELFTKVYQMIFNILEEYHVHDTPTNNWLCTCIWVRHGGLCDTRVMDI